MSLGGSAKERPSRAWGEGEGGEARSVVFYEGLRLWEARFVVFYEGLRLWEARFVVFYEGLRLWEAHLYVFYVSGRLSAGRMSNGLVEHCTSSSWPGLSELLLSSGGTRV